MTANIYGQHRAAFPTVSAFVVLSADGEKVATVAIKFPGMRSERLYAYVQLLGVSMVRAFVGGGGYDKRSAAVSAAIGKIPAYGEGYGDTEFSRKFEANRAAFNAATADMDSRDWVYALEARGFKVYQAV
jgi:hypothetical protein